MNFVDTHNFSKYFFSIGIEEESKKYYISIPVSNQFVDYEEYFEIDEDTYNLHTANLEKLISIAELCRKRDMDEFLFYEPGTDRGEPR
jgi:hypothetical protein